MARTPEDLKRFLSFEEITGIFLGTGERLEKLKDLLSQIREERDLARVWETDPEDGCFFPEQGLLYEPPGFLRRTDTRGDGLLALRERLREIEGLERELEEREKEILREKTQAEQNLQQLEDTYRKKDLEYQEMHRQDQEIQKKLQILNRTLERLEDEQVFQQKEAREIKRKKEELLQQKKELEKALERQREELSGLIQRETKLRREGEDRRSKILDLEKIFKEKESLLAEWRGNLKARRERLLELRQSKQRAEARRRTARQQEALLSEELTFVRQMLREEKKQRQELEKKREALKETLSRWQEELTRAQHALKELEQEEKDLERERTRLQEKIHRLELDKVEAEMTMEHLRREALENHATALEDFLKQEPPKSENLREIEERLILLRERLSRFPAVNLAAAEELARAEERLHFLSSQRQDLLSAISDLEKALRRLDQESRKRLQETLREANRSLKEVFPVFFEGGEAELYFTDEDPLSAGLDLRIRLPGKPVKHLTMLSGGEKALCVLAVLFAFYLVKPGPFCILDEVDAPLDEANTLRFNEFLRRLKERSQIILVTHNPRVMEVADALFGVTMEEKGISKVVSVRLN